MGGSTLANNIEAIHRKSLSFLLTFQTSSFFLKNFNGKWGNY